MARAQGDARRPVGTLALLALGVNGIVGVGIFFAPADVARVAPGGASVLVVAGTALALLPVALCFAALGRRFDEDGGPVVYARAAFGPAWGFVVGWITYVSAIASAAAVSYGLASALLASFGFYSARARSTAATVLVTVLALVCAAGLRVSARAWTGLTVLKLVPLLALVAAWAYAGLPGAPASVDAPPPSWLRAALLATFAYQGFEIVPVIAGHVRAPHRAVPLATVGSLVVAALLYLALQAAAVAALPGLSTSPAPLAEAAARLGGPGLGALLTVGTSVSALGITLGMIAATPHYLAATAKGGQLPFGLAAFDERAVPLRALLATWFLVCVLVQAGTLTELFALSSAAVLTQYVVTAASLFALARRRERGLGPRHMALAVPAALVGLSLVTGASRREALIAAAAVAVGFLLRAAAPRGGPGEAR